MWDKILSVSWFGAICGAIGAAVPPAKDEFELAREEIERQQQEPLDKEAFRRSLEVKKHAISSA